jgi:ureidoglycolate lyase
MLPLPVEPLSPAAFSAFGDVIQTEGAETLTINEGTATRYNNLARIDVAHAAGTPRLSIFQANSGPRPPIIRMLERHPLGSQAFVPLAGADWLIVVADGKYQPTLSSMRCFRATVNQGVNFSRGTWHHPLLVLAPRQDFIVIDRGGPGWNTDEFWFPAEAMYRSVEI